MKVTFEGFGDELDGQEIEIPDNFPMSPPKRKKPSPSKGLVAFMNKPEDKLDDDIKTQIKVLVNEWYAARKEEETKAQFERELNEYILSIINEAIKITWAKSAEGYNAEYWSGQRTYKELEADIIEEVHHQLNTTKGKGI